MLVSALLFPSVDCRLGPRGLPCSTGCRAKIYAVGILLLGFHYSEAWGAVKHDNYTFLRKCMSRRSFRSTLIWLIFKAAIWSPGWVSGVPTNARLFGAQMLGVENKGPSWSCLWALADLKNIREARWEPDADSWLWFSYQPKHPITLTQTCSP